MKNLFVTALLTGTIISAGTPVMASDVGDNSPVPRLPSAHTLEKRHEISPTVGLFLGGSIGVVHDDNINKQKLNEKEDELLIVRPEFVLRTDLESNELVIKGAIEDGTFSQYESNNYTDVDVKVNYRHDFSDITALHNYMRYRYDHIDIGSLDDEPQRNLTEPTTYHYGEIGTYLERTPESYKYQLGIEGRIYDYLDSGRSNGTININDDRDRSEGETWVRFGKYIQPALLPYVEVRGNIRKYHEMIDNTATVGRDSAGGVALVGAEWGDKRGAYYLDANIGYQVQTYDEGIFADVSTAAFNADGFWQASEALRLKTGISRSIEETTNTGISSYLRTRIKGEAEYKLTPKWMVSSYMRATENDFQSNPVLTVGRTDMTYDGSVGARYQINGMFAVGMDYTHTNRLSDSRPDIEYERNLLMLRVVAADF